MLQRFGSWLREQRVYLAETYGDCFENASHDERMEAFRLYNLAAHTELAEALQELDWKTWRSSSHDRDAAVLELIDLLVFTANMFVVLEVTDEELEDRYAAIIERNALRQEARA